GRAPPDLRLERVLRRQGGPGHGLARGGARGFDARVRDRSREPRARRDRHAHAGHGAWRIGRGLRRRRALSRDEGRGGAAPGRRRGRRHPATRSGGQARGRSDPGPAPDRVITDPWFYAAAIPAVLLVGISKGGFGSGAGIFATPLMALTIPIPQ